MPRLGACFHPAPAYAAVLRHLNLSPETIFTDPRIHAWRSIPERENCTLDATTPDNRPLRLHIKRYRPTQGSAAADEARGLQLLSAAEIPTASLVAWGMLDDGRSFLITEDLAGYTPLDKLLATGLPFATVLEPTADLAARLHSARLHHRDLYLCHFFAKADATPPALALIDAGRVKPLPPWPFRRRWIIKDLAQFWYSTQALPISDAQRLQWLDRYAAQRGLSPASLLSSIQRKAAWIARHDAKLRQRQPARNVSLSTP